MNEQTILVFTHNGMGDAPEDLRHNLARKFLQLSLDAGRLPAKIVFYTEGVKLACEGSSVLDQLRALRKRGVELLLCSTCLDYFGLTSKVAAGIVGGMPDIIEAMHMADKVNSL